MFSYCFLRFLRRFDDSCVGGRESAVLGIPRNSKKRQKVTVSAVLGIPRKYRKCRTASTVTKQCRTASTVTKQCRTASYRTMNPEKHGRTASFYTLKCRTASFYTLKCRTASTGYPTVPYGLYRVPYSAVRPLSIP